MLARFLPSRPMNSPIAKSVHLPGCRSFSSTVGNELDLRCVPSTILQLTQALYRRHLQTSLTHESSLPSCCSCPGILPELFWTLTVPQEMMMLKQRELLATITTCFSVSSTHHWFKDLPEPTDDCALRRGLPQRGKWKRMKWIVETWVMENCWSYDNNSHKSLGL